MQSIILQVREKDPDQIYRILWQRSFPKEYQALIREADKRRRAEGDPFSVPFTTPNSELTPSSFGSTSEWGKGLPHLVFDRLGYPTSRVEDGVLVEKIADISWNSDSGIFEIHHTAKAIEAFRSRFPEFEVVSKVEVEQNAGR